MKQFKNTVFFLMYTLLLSSCGGGSSESPKEPVSSETRGKIALTFDDVYVDDWYRESFTIENMGATATFFISRYGDVTAPVNTRNTQMTNRLLQLQERGFEIANHTLTHFRANEYTAEYGIEQWFNTEVMSSVCNMIEDGFDIYSFAYPNSNSSTPDTDTALHTVFDGVRTYHGSEMDYTQGVVDDNDQSHVIAAAGIDERFLDIERLYDIIDRISENDETLVLTAHDITSRNDTQLYIKPRSLEKIINYAKNKNVEFINFKEIKNSRKVDSTVCTQ